MVLTWQPLVTHAFHLLPRKLRPLRSYRGGFAAPRVLYCTIPFRFAFPQQVWVCCTPCTPLHGLSRRAHNRDLQGPWGAPTTEGQVRLTPCTAWHNLRTTHRPCAQQAHALRASRTIKVSGDYPQQGQVHLTSSTPNQRTTHRPCAQQAYAPRTISVSGEYSRMSGRALAMRGSGRPRLLHMAAVLGSARARRLMRLRVRVCVCVHASVLGAGARARICVCECACALAHACACACACMRPCWVWALMRACLCVLICALARACACASPKRVRGGRGGRGHASEACTRDSA